MCVWIAHQLDHVTVFRSNGQLSLQSVNLCFHASSQIQIKPGSPSFFLSLLTFSMSLKLPEGNVM